MEKKFIVCTDSGCDLDISVLNENEIYPLALQYEVNGEVVTDSMVQADCHIFYDNMRNGAVPKTSQGNFSQFVELWTPLVEQYHLPIIHISLGSGVSGTFNNGVLAVDMVKEEHPDAEIHIIDSTLCSIGYGMLALRAAEMRAKAVFKENLLQQMIASKQRKLSAMGENRAQRKRLDHLKYALGGQLVSYQYLEQAFVKCLLLNARNMAEYNKLRSEIIEFFPKALAEREYLQTEINTEPRFMLEKKKHAPTEKVE